MKNTVPDGTMVKLPGPFDGHGHLRRRKNKMMDTVAPDVIGKMLNIPYQVADFFGGTALLIVVGVSLDTIKQIESQLLMRHYEGFMKRGRIHGRQRSY